MHNLILSQESQPVDFHFKNMLKILCSAIVEKMTLGAIVYMVKWVKVT